MIVGALIIFFLIVEPHGLARLWQIGKAEAEGVAVSVLMVQDRRKFRRGGQSADPTIVAGSRGTQTKTEARQLPASNKGRNMKARHLLRGWPARPAGGPVLPARRRRKTSIYVPLFTYRTGPYRQFRHPDRQRHARLSHHAERA